MELECWQLEQRNRHPGNCAAIIRDPGRLKYWIPDNHSVISGMTVLLKPPTFGTAAEKESGGKMQIKKIFLGTVVVIFFPILAIGQTPMMKTVYCPSISALKKDPIKQTWSAPGGFKNFDLSFVTSITAFLGAQWRGATIGQVTCVYQGLPKKSFNVLLSFGTLSYEPTGGAWGKNLGGYRNCISRRRKQCAFDVQLKPKNGNIYQEIENFKS